MNWKTQNSLFRLVFGGGLFVFIGAVACSISSAQSKPKYESMPGLSDSPRDDQTPSPVDFFGFAIGSRHLRHDQVTAYFKALAETSDRVSLIDYGKSHGGRPLYTLAISSPENIVNLNAIRKSRQRLASGRLNEAPPDTKLIMFMGYCVHGDEASAINAAPIVAYHLASESSPKTLEALEQAVFFIDPALNPDGVDRFANWVNENRGRFASESPEDREHIAPWPGGRTNYYWFDLNRDWLPLSHPESQGRARLFHQWKPNVVLDYHEMGGNSTYFFQPGVPARNNPLSPPENLQLTRQFASRYAQTMDEAGELYFTEEIFDDFYIGKGSTYPDLNGSVGILFEQGSTRGLKMKTTGIKRHFANTVANQVRTSLSSVDRLIELKQPLIDFQIKFFRNALTSGQNSSTSAYILTGTPSRVLAAKSLLQQHGIRCNVNQQLLRHAGRTFAAKEALVIPTAQPQFVLVQSLMQTEQDFKENIFYDVSAWHLPSAFDLEMHQFESDIPDHWLTNGEPNRSETKVDKIDWESIDESRILGIAFSPVELEAPQWVSALMQLDAELRVSMVPFDNIGHDNEVTNKKAISIESNRDRPNNGKLPEGSFLVLRSGNEAKWKLILRKFRELDRRSSVTLRLLTTGRNENGPDLGSSRIAVLPKCNPALIVGTGTAANSAGAIWHFLDHRMAQPATLIDADRVGRADLGQYSCIIIPAGGFQNWSKQEATALERYAQQGGTIVASETAITWLNRNGVVKLRSSSVETGSDAETYDGSQPPRAVDAAEEAATSSVESAQSSKNKPAKPKRFADAQESAALESIAGAFFMTKIDPTHPLGFGFPDESVPVFRDSTTVYAQPANPLQVAASYDHVIAGYVSQRNRDRINGTPAVWVQPIGQGRVIFIADLPVFRGYVRSSERFLTNAILLGPVLRIPSLPRD